MFGSLRESLGLLDELRPLVPAPASLLKHLLQELRTPADTLGLLARALNVPLVLLLLFSGFVALVHWTPAGAQLQARMNPNTVLVIACIASGVLFVDSLLRGLIQHYAEQVELLKTAGGLLQGLIRGLLIALGLLMLLDTLGISITPLIASIGIGASGVACTNVLFGNTA